MSEFVATEYFTIDRNHPDAPRLSGIYLGEFLNNSGVYNFPHLAKAERGAFGGRIAWEGEGALVVEGISPDGWRQICDYVYSENASPNKQQLSQALCRSLYITWDKPHQDIGRLNAIAAAKRAA